jgi:uncharacterized protein YjhX (UPF0386 family)
MARLSPTPAPWMTWRMARLPDDTVLGGAPSLRSGRGVVDISGMESMGVAVAKGAAELGEGIRAVGVGLEKREDADGAFQVAQANANYLTKKIELDQRFDEDQDHATRKERYERELATIASESRGQIAIPKFQQRFDIRLQPLTAQAIAGQQDKARKQLHDKEAGYVGEMGVRLGNQAAETDDEDSRKMLTDGYAAMVNGLVARGIKSEEQGRAMQQQFARQVLEGRVTSAASSGDPERISQTINELRARPGTPEAIVSRIDRIEGTTKNRSSSAFGTGQFIESTWLAMIKKHRPDLAQGRSDGDILELRADRNLGREMIGRYAADNNAILQRNGVQVTPGNTYLAHFLGPAGAVAVLKADGSRPVQDVLAAAVGADKARQMVQANPTILQGRQAGSVVEWSNRKMGGAENGSILQILPPDQRASLEGRLLAAQQQRQAGDLATFRTRIADGEQEALRTGGVTTQIPRGEFIANMGAEAGTRAHAAYQGNIQFGQDLQTIANLSPEQTADLLQKYEPQPGAAGYADQAKRQDALVRAAAKVSEERAKDPGGFAVTRLPAVNEAYQNFEAIVSSPGAAPEQRRTAARVFAEVTLAEQARLGVPEASRRIVPKNYIDGLNERITKPDKDGGPANVAARIQAEAEIWGDQWPLVYRDLQAKTTPIVRVIGSGVTPYAARILVENANIPVKEIINDQSDVRLGTLRTEIGKAFAPLRQSLAGNENEQAIFNDFQSMGEKLAAHYVRGGKGDVEAAEAAFSDLVGHKYDFVTNSVGGGWFKSAPTYRVPKAAGVPKEAVAAGAENARRMLDQFKVRPLDDDIGGVNEPNRVAARIDNYRRDGVWVTAPGDVGLALVYRDQAVRKADGKPLVITWEGLEALAKSSPDNLDQPLFYDRGSAIGQLFK